MRGQVVAPLLPDLVNRDDGNVAVPLDDGRVFLFHQGRPFWLTAGKLQEISVPSGHSVRWMMSSNGIWLGSSRGLLRVDGNTAVEALDDQQLNVARLTGVGSSIYLLTDFDPNHIAQGFSGEFHGLYQLSGRHAQPVALPKDTAIRDANPCGKFLCVATSAGLFQVEGSNATKLAGTHEFGLNDFAKVWFVNGTIWATDLMAEVYRIQNGDAEPVARSVNTVVIGGEQQAPTLLEQSLSWVFNVVDLNGDTVICARGGAYAYRSGQLEALLDRPLIVKDIRRIGAETFLSASASGFFDDLYILNGRTPRQVAAIEPKSFQKYGRRTLINASGGVYVLYPEVTLETVFEPPVSWRPVAKAGIWFGRRGIPQVQYRVPKETTDFPGIASKTLVVAFANGDDYGDRVLAMEGEAMDLDIAGYGPFTLNYRVVAGGNVTTGVIRGVLAPSPVLIGVGLLAAVLLAIVLVRFVHPVRRLRVLRAAGVQSYNRHWPVLRESAIPQGAPQNVAAPVSNESPKRPTVQPKVFISYVREDTDYREEVAARLEGQHMIVLGDWKLAPGPDYVIQLRGLIRESEVLLLLLSDDSIRSLPVAAEIEQAENEGKRIVPVVIRPVTEESRIPAPVRRPQWVFWTEANPSDGISRIEEAIYTDFEQLEVHTEILLRAERWLAEKCDKTLLVRGSLLRRAERWIETTLHADQALRPRPTPLQSRYVIESRRQLTRSLSAVGLLALFILIGAVYGAVQLRNRGQAAKRAEAERQTQVRLTESRSLASDALNLIPFRYKEAAETAAKAIERSATPEAVDASRQVAILRGAIDAKFEIAQVVQAGFAGPHALAALGANPNPHTQSADAYLWVECGDSSANYTKYRATYVMSGDGKQDLRFLAASPSGLVAAANGSAAYLWTFPAVAPRDCSGLNLIERPAQPAVFRPDQGITALAVSSDGRFLATGDSRGTTSIWPTGKGMVNTIRYVAKWPEYQVDAQGRKTNAAGDQNLAGVTALAFTPDGSSVAVATEAGAVLIWPLEQTAPKPIRIDVLQKAHAVAFRPDGKFVAIGSDSGIHVASATGESIAEDLPTQSPVNAVSFSQNGLYLVSGSEDGKVHLWDVRGIDDPNLLAGYPRGAGRLLMMLAGHTGAVRSLAVNDTDLYASGSTDGSIVIRTFHLPDKPATTPGK